MSNLIEIYSVPGKVVGHFDKSINGIVDTWESMLISLDEFKASVFDIGIDFAKKNKVTAWIVDSSQGEGVFKKEVQDFTESTVAPTCAKIGIRFFFVVLPPSAVAKLSAKKISRINADQIGMQTIEVVSLNEAYELLAEANGLQE